MEWSRVPLEFQLNLRVAAMSLKINIDVSSLAAQFKELAIEAEREITKAVAGLAAMTHARVAEQAAQKLKSSLKDFQDNLGFEEVQPGIWVVSIDQPAMWIEEGIEPGHDMKPDLLKNAEVSPNGKRHRVIPFNHSAAPTSRNANADRIVQELKSGLNAINKQRKQADPKSGNISITKIEKNADGSPRVGKLHEFDIPSDKPTANAKHPALKGVTIYQSKSGSTGNIRRDVLTFRTVSDGSDPNSWIHPGYKANHFLDDAEVWALNEWENKILPDLLTGMWK